MTTTTSVYDLLAANGWVRDTTGIHSYRLTGGRAHFRRGQECLYVKLTGANSRITSGEYSRPRREGEVDDLPEDYNPAWGVPAVYTRVLPRKGTTAAALAL